MHYKREIDWQLQDFVLPNSLLCIFFPLTVQRSDILTFVCARNFMQGTDCLFMKPQTDEEQLPVTCNNQPSLIQFNSYF